ncbi:MULTISPECIES: ABC transporter ATP-binding protein [Enterococcus]|jgi:ATP-binding cassette subfamily B protein AbcA/BmrA|uniref:ABC transporter ATP-binding protein n=1 Tax=Enterococcus TaxID=1350 RepID=UPI000D394B15|nr:MULTISPECIES: ABC transporter ATP-binding protein [Enterococcus]MDB1567213.1 ABC transporter ATP-binding protein [Enterococcus faecalis]MDB1569806.1 ABC transporter ATP-binding protein [Enterococcus faecalis]MDB1575347.1 ABC transporter ATP-binding protein [Enterococcus faecalis]MDB1650064.1 ABC transporter ATP-binding protein [Enterococcus faecalis]MDB1658016.1 ABC transporter ATP-binding protein [Enterococcus faecalis]
MAVGGGGKNSHDSIRADKTKFSFKEFLGLIKMTEPNYLLLGIGMIFLVISSSIQVYVPKLASSLVNNFQKGVDYSLLGKVVGLFIFSALVSALGGTILGIFGENVIQNMRKRLWNKLTILKVSYFDSVKAGEISSRVVNDTNQVKQLLAVTFPQTVASVITVIGTVYMMIKMDWHMSLAMVIAVPVVILCMIPVMAFGSKVSHIRQDAMSQFNGLATETLSEIRLVKTSNAESQAQVRAANEVDRLFNVGKKEAIFDASMQPIMMMVFMSMVFGLLAYGMHRIAIGVMTIGTLMSFLMYLFNLIGAMPIIATLFSEVAKAAGSTRRVQELLSREPEDFESGQDIDLSEKTLSVKNVKFSYEDAPEEPILTDISFTAQPNQVIAFAGPSGGGKSTIFSLIERFYEPTEGQIKFGDIDIKDIKLSDYRRQIGFVSQDSAIMEGTIRDNLTYGLAENFSDEQLWDVLELAYARKFVEEMPDKLNTEVGERGVKISGGQRQRIAIARAFLRNPKILMLDEATASLDSESEMKVQEALSNLMKGRTTLVIAHRLSTIVDADSIYFVEKGKVTGSGKHDELVSKHKTYAKYVSEQFKVTE